MGNHVAYNWYDRKMLSMNSENQNKILNEMRRGIITIAVLSQLDEMQYGYSLIKKLEEKGLTEAAEAFPKRLETIFSGVDHAYEVCRLRGLLDDILHPWLGGWIKWCYL